MANTKNTAARKYDAIARDYRVASIRAATAEECEGEAGWVVVTLGEGHTWEGLAYLTAHSVPDARAQLATVVTVEVSE